MFVFLATIVSYIGTSIHSLIAKTDWQMKFNVAKCHSMRVTRHLPSNQTHCNYSISTYAGKGSILQIPWIYYLSQLGKGVKMFLKFLVKQQRHLVFFGAIWLLHLGIQRKLHTKHGPSSARVCCSYLSSL